MTFQDIFLTPIYLTLMFGLVYALRKNATNPLTKHYYMIGFSLKAGGAIGVGLVYWFIYGGGDTFHYFNHSGIVWQALLDDPYVGIKILFSNGEYDPDTYNYVKHLEWYRDTKTFVVVKVATVFDIFSIHTYSVTALCFALACFSGVWALYRSLVDMYPILYKEFGRAVFFLPSVFFWGSGLLKDTLTLGAMGWAFYGFYFGIIKNHKRKTNILILLTSIWAINAVKGYILICLIPAMGVWMILQYRDKMKKGVFKALLIPLLILFALPIAYVISNSVLASLEEVAKTAKITAEWVGREGSVYSLGEFDGTFASVIVKFPAAVFVSLFRPFLWEARNPVMLLSALEALFFSFLTIQTLWRTKGNILKTMFAHPFIIFCFTFAILFAFEVGVTSYNFGSLVRYKIPMMPFYIAGMYILRHYGVKKLEVQNTKYEAGNMKYQV